MIADDALRYEPLFPGDPAPWFRQRCIGRAGLFSFDMMAGRFVLLCFYGAFRDAQAQAALAGVRSRRSLFDNAEFSFLGVSTEAHDETVPELAQSPGAIHFADSDGSVSRAFGVAPLAGPPHLAVLRRGWFILDPRLRIVAKFSFDEAGAAAALAMLERLPAVAAYHGDAPAPVLTVPGVFEPEFCTRLIDAHRAERGQDSPILIEGAIVKDHDFKRRRDVRLSEPALVNQVHARIVRRVIPEIRHVFQFNATRMERLIVAVYDAADAGRFGPHRDNTIAATAHRRFAVSINLNDDFEGGGLVFPEYSARVYRPPVGGALVFSCSLMHAVLPMTRGRRYACLPFVYDDAAVIFPPKSGRG
jgi:predicted 2-oxoglutarate/Fe(II)-dependent dioxygenase YbiX/peroxiredoxin